MAHQHLVALALLPHAIEKRAAVADLHKGAAELVMIGCLDLAAELGDQRLLAVADAEQRHAHLEGELRGARRIVFRHRCRAAGKDDAARSEVADAREIGVEGHDLAIDACFAYAPRDELGELAAEIENKNLVGRSRHYAFLEHASIKCLISAQP